MFRKNDEDWTIERKALLKQIKELEEKVKDLTAELDNEKQFREEFEELTKQQKVMLSKLQNQSEIFDELQKAYQQEIKELFDSED